MKTEDITKPHIESYNGLFMNKIFKNIIKKIKPLTIDNFRMEIVDYNIHQPYLAESNNISIDRRLLPRECRLTNTTYKGKLFVKFNLYFDDKLVLSELRQCGGFPIMVKSGFCHLVDEENPNAIDEDENDIGGYFIINGIDKLVRFHIMQKRNYCFALCRPQKNKIYTDNYIYIRSVGDDELGHVNYLHYTVDGDVFFRFYRRRNEFHIPAIIVLKSLINTTDIEIFNMLNKDTYILVPLNKAAREKVYSRNECIEYIGARFKQAIYANSNSEACIEILDEYILPHLKSSQDKFNFIIHGIKKLFCLVRGEIIPDDSDSPASHEMLTETQLFANIFKDKLEDVKKNFRLLYNKTIAKKKTKRKNDEKIEITDTKPLLENFLHAFKYIECSIVGRGFESFLSTGNINIQNSSDILQNAGFCIIAERINFYRYISHFRSVNRGSFFQEVRTTGVRKLKSESWGFFCPVHTPDGTPCGLLTHLTSSATLTTKPCTFNIDILYSFGVIPALRQFVKGISVFYNGMLVGFTVSPKDLTCRLRQYRRGNALNIEIVHYFGTKLYEAVYIYNTVARLVRSVKHRASGLNENIGIMEQVFLDINLKELAHREKESTYIQKNFAYEEIDNQNIFSIVAGLTPFSEYNQSPRNMYQCQMAKQSMGIPAHNIKTRNDNKMYMLNYTQHPIVRNKNYQIVQDYPLGLNCIVAVLSYTAYDMEDAMVINKGSMERGLFNGYVYKTDKIDLPRDCYFTYLPEVGQKINTDEVLYKYMDLGGKETVFKCKSSDGYIIDCVDVFQNDHICANIKYRIIRNPNIGDKFCSRHGQKGVCSMHWPTIDMPFTESGVVPDIIINPHAFPSRMTIGMLIESMAGKSGCCLGEIQDATAFEKNAFLDENNKEYTSESIGEQLKNHGFNYHGNEPMYSGITGTEFKTDVFIGVVFYQRLRHMVNDKFQVRASGAVVATTRQPVGGRKNAGGVRFGEMERDAMIAHGTPYLLNDRLLKCSDHSVFTYCCKCKSILFANNNKCICGGKTFNTMELPYVFKYLCSELLAMNIRVILDFKQPIN
jgi:DNA-directed RNA polymerase I subunit RPA2